MMKLKQVLQDPISGEKVTPESPFSVEYSGMTYFFSTEEDMIEFQQRPDVYARRLSRGQIGKAPAVIDLNE
jgi:YHS domain-containing protein